MQYPNHEIFLLLNNKKGSTQRRLFMFTKNRSILQALMIVVAFSVFVGCSSTGKKPAGASARAEKSIVDNGPTDFDDNGRPTGTPIHFGDLDPSLCNRIHFDYDKSEIKPEFTDCLNKIAAFLAANPDLKVLIEGHCDERGTQEYNIALGEKRAMTAVDYLVAKGVNASRFNTSSKGEEDPLAMGSNEAAWKQNRRAELYAIK
jgi:peptidoglycan-associated lipoprotein